MAQAYLVATVHETFVIQLLEDPPNAFHEGWIHGLVVILEINPTTQTCDVMLHVSTSNYWNTIKLS